MIAACSTGVSSKKKCLFSLVLLLTGTSCFTQQKKQLSLQQVLDSVQSIVATDHTPGLMLGITGKDSTVFSGGFGFADVQSGRKVNAQTLFRMGSITKMFVSLAILQLVHEGKLGLQDEVKKIAPAIPFKNDWEQQHPVRIVHLLEHTAGFDDMKLNRMCSQDEKEYTGKEMVLLQKNSLISRWPPGERFAYSNPGYVLLGYIIEKISGQSYERYIAEHIFAPLGMQHSNLHTRSKIPAADTKQYVVHGGKIIEVPSVNVLMAPAGTLWSCADDMLKFLRLFLANGQPLFTASLIHEMETVHSTRAAKSGLVDGYAPGNSSMLLYNNYGWRGYGGLMGTCFSTFAYNRSLGAGFIISSNGNQQNYRVEQLVADFLEQGFPVSKTDTMATDLAAITPFLGQYQFENPRNEIGAFKDKLLNTPALVLENELLFVKPLLGEKFRLVQTAPAKFAMEGANAATVVFTRNENGQRVMIMNGEYFEQVPAITVKWKRWAALLAVAFALSAVLAGFFSLMGYFMGRVQKNQLLLRVLPAFAAALLVWAVLSLLQVQTESYLLSELTDINSRTLIIFLGTLLFGASSMLHLILVLRKLKQFEKKLYVYYWLATALSLCYISFVLFQNGWIGLRTWTM